MSKQNTGTREKADKFSDQQKQLLLWMLERDEEKLSLIDEATSSWKAHSLEHQYQATQIAWSSRSFINGEPSKTQIASLSRSLSFLRQRGYIKLIQSRGGKKPRTSHIAFTLNGRMVAEAMRQNIKVSQAIQYFDEQGTKRIAMLDVCLILLKREIKRIDVALETDPQDFRKLEIPRFPHGTATTRKQAENFRAAVSKALSFAELERHADDRAIDLEKAIQEIADQRNFENKINKVMQKFADYEEALIKAAKR